MKDPRNSSGSRPKIATAQGVSSLYRHLFGDRRILVATHREPVVWVERPGEEAKKPVSGGPRLRYPAGGVSQSLHRLLLQTGGDWVALRSSPGPDPLTVRLPEQPASYDLHRILLADERLSTGYQRFANDLLWPLFHEEPGRVLSVEGDFDNYRRVNALFADRMSTLLQHQHNGFVFIHDYQLALVAQRLRPRLPSPAPPLAFFWHIPWPRPVFLEAIPERAELVRGLLEHDLLGFQTPLYRDRFLEAAGELLGKEVRIRRNTVIWGERRIHVGDYPIGVDPGRFESLAQSPEGPVLARNFLRKAGMDPEAPFLIAVDRMDYTKGFLKRMEILDRLFTRYPEHLGSLRLLQIAPPTRTTHAPYRSYQAKVREAVEKTNARWSRGGEPPVVTIDETVDHRTLAPLYRLAAGALVTSTNDGMNLVAKEYLASQKEAGGTLFLSRHAGAAHGLRDAVLIDPYDPEGAAEIIHRTLGEPLAIRTGRNRILREEISRHNIYEWMESILNEVHDTQETS
ncbi:MAG: alpha,alpha-trehalose-phosphate synthase (UDP-forming) [Leptospirillia bacterium]